MQEGTPQPAPDRSIRVFVEGAAYRVDQATGDSLRELLKGQEEGPQDRSPPMIIDGVLYGMDQIVANWVIKGNGGGTAIAVEHVSFGIVKEQTDLNGASVEDTLLAGAIFFNHTKGDQSDIFAAVYAEDVYAGHPDVIGRILDYPFRMLQVRRITAEIDMWNERSIRNAEMLGFKLEGIKRKRGRDGGDLGVFGLLPEECEIWQRWQRKQPHEQSTLTTAAA